MADLDQWPEHAWTPSTPATKGQEDDTVIRIPFVLTPIYMEKKMGQRDKEEYKQMMAQLTEELPESVDTMLATLLSKAEYCMSVFPCVYEGEPAFPVRLQELVDACNYFCLRNELRRRLFKFNRLVDTDMRDYLTLALEDPRSPLLQQLVSAIRTHCNELTLFKNKIIEYNQVKENLGLLDEFDYDSSDADLDDDSDDDPSSEISEG